MRSGPGCLIAGRAWCTMRCFPSSPAPPASAGPFLLSDDPGRVLGKLGVLGPKDGQAVHALAHAQVPVRKGCGQAAPEPCWGARGRAGGSLAADVDEALMGHSKELLAVGLLHGVRQPVQEVVHACGQRDPQWLRPGAGS